MGRVLKGEALGMLDMLVPLLVASALAALCVAVLVHQLRRAAWR
jgi:hypothetical protein